MISTFSIISCMENGIVLFPLSLSLVVAKDSCFYERK